MAYDLSMKLPQLKDRLSRWLDSAGSDGTKSGRTEIEKALSSRKELDPSVVDAVLRVPRERFVSSKDRSRAHEDRALSIGNSQTISQPSLVAHMISELKIPDKSSRVLDVGCGSGYQAAILSLLAKEVISVERIVTLADTARTRLTRLGYTNVQVVYASEDHIGYPEAGPYDAVIVGASVPEVPQTLVAQLKVGGRMVIPIGRIRHQRVATIVKTETGINVNYGLDCVFVPLIGPDAW